VLCGSPFSDDCGEDDYEDDDDEDDYIDTDSLGDWRNFRRSLAMGGSGTKDTANENNSNDSTSNNDSNKKSESSSESNTVSGTPSMDSWGDERNVTENEKVLKKQSKELAEEYATDLWAYETPTPEVGGLVLRMPIEVELYRNYKHSIMGSKLRAILVRDARDMQQQQQQQQPPPPRNKNDDAGAPPDEPNADDLDMAHWYRRSHDMVEDQMKQIADMADHEGQIDASTLPEDHSEMLALYLENQEEWQEVSLVLERGRNGRSQSAKTLVLNRPMAFKLTKDLAKIVYLGAFDGGSTGDQDGKDATTTTTTTTTTASSGNGYGYGTKTTISETAKKFTRFTIAFQEECAVYVGGPDHQGEPAVMIHGIAGLEGAVETSPGSRIYRGGTEAAIDGVLEGRYDPLEFRFFVGCHDYRESMLDVEVMLGKLQPIACSRVLALKQCISLPKPLWHEVMELCGGDDGGDGYLPDVSRLEFRKHQDVTFQVMEDDGDGDDMEIIVDDFDDIDADVDADIDIDDIDFEIRDDEEEDDDDEDEGPWRW